MNALVRIIDSILISAIELTTYETFNYILYGLVNELVCLGCKEELILTTLQMYAAYLRSHEIAFFGKRETKLPKMPFKYKLRFVRCLLDFYPGL